MSYGFEPPISSSLEGVHFTWRETPLLMSGAGFDRYSLEDSGVPS